MKHFLSIVLAGLAASGYAIPFDNSTGGPATVVVNEIAGPGVDYTSLGEASTAFNSVSGGIKRSWTILIDSDLTEPNSIAFGNNVEAGNKLIIKPNVGKTPTITFTSSAVPYSSAIFGCFLIGANNGALNNGPENVDPTYVNIFATNDAYVIDGSNTVNGITRDLTIKNTTADANGHIIRVVGASNGTIIKNSRILQLRSVGAASGISFGAGKYAGFEGADVNGNFRSNNCTVENCYIEAKSSPGGTATVGIGLNSSHNVLTPTGATPADITANYQLEPGLHFENFTIKNNDFDVKHRGIGLHYIINSVYENNRIAVRNTTSGGSSAGIIHLAQNTPNAPYNLTIKNNIIHTLQTINTSATGGIAGISVGVSGTNPPDTRPTYVIYNNVITGFAQTTTDAATDQIARGIEIASSGTNCDIQHNSINLDISGNLKSTGTTAGKVAGIVMATNVGLEVKKMKNNIIRVNTGSTVGNAYRSATGLISGVDNVGGNDFVKIGGGNLVSILTRNYATLTDLAASTNAGDKDHAGGGAQSVDPATLTPAWESLTTAQWPLGFASIPAGLGKAAATTVATDINGVNRGTENVYPGAYAIAKSDVADWSTY